MGRPRDCVEIEHEVGNYGTQAAADDLRGHVRNELPSGQPAQDSVGQAHDRIEMGAGDGAECEDQRDQPRAGGDAVLEQLEADVVRREPLGEDARADDDGDEQCGADGLSRGAASEVAVHSAAASR